MRDINPFDYFPMTDEVLGYFQWREMETFFPEINPWPIITTPNERSSSLRFHFSRDSRGTRWVKWKWLKYVYWWWENFPQYHPFRDIDGWRRDHSLDSASSRLLWHWRTLRTNGRTKRHQLSPLVDSMCYRSIIPKTRRRKRLALPKFHSKLLFHVIRASLVGCPS